MVKVTLSVNGEIVKRAKELGLNLSQCLENCLKLYINALENANNTIISNQISELENKHGKGRLQETVGVLWWTGRDLNPRPPDCKSGVHSRLNYRPFIFIDDDYCIIFKGFENLFISI